MSLEAIEARTLSEFIGSNQRKLRNDHKRGRQDGQRQIPPADGDFYPFLEEAIADARKALQDYDVELDRYINEASSRAERLETERDEEYARRRGDLVAEKQAALARLDRLGGPTSTKVVRTRQRYEDADRAYRNLQIKLNRPVRTQFVYAYVPLLLILFVPETFINRLAFELFFQETAVISWILAAAIGGLFLGLAHFVGLWLRREAQHVTIVSRIGLLTAVVVAVGISATLMYLIAKVRQAYISFVEGERAIGADLSALIRGEQISLPGFDALLDVPLDQAGYMLIAMNVAIFLVAGVFSFVRHDPHPDYEKLERRKDREERQLSRLSDRFARDSGRLSRDFDERIRHLDGQIDSLEGKLQQARGEIAAAEQARVQNRMRVAKSVNSRVTHYQSGNVEGRLKNEIPACFEGWNDEQILERVAIVVTWPQPEPGPGRPTSARRSQCAES
jgi:hypothetical protein